MDSQKANDTQTSDCSNKWKSKIKKVEEGHFHNLKVDASGNITGKFEGKDIISGRCEEPSGGEHRMTLKRDDDKNNYEYSGVITDLGSGNFECKGTRTTSPKAKSLEEEKSRDDKDKDKDKDTDPEEWIAEKIIT